MNRIYEQLQGQAAILAYCDSFRMLSAITLVLAFLALLMPRNKLHHAASPEALAVH